MLLKPLYCSKNMLKKEKFVSCYWYGINCKICDYFAKTWGGGGGGGRYFYNHRELLNDDFDIALMRGT